MSLKKICTRILHPPNWLIFILSFLCAVALIGIFTGGLEESIPAYVVYTLSFYSLTVVCISGSRRIPKGWSSLKERVYNNEYGKLYLTNPVFKTQIKLYRAFLINLLYIGFNLFSALYYKTAWFAIFVCYYGIMATMRFLLIKYANKNSLGRDLLKELKRSRLCAWILLTVNAAVSGAVLMMLFFNRGFEYRGLLIYVMAVYTFYITTIAIINIIKYKKYKSPIMSMAKIIDFAAALMSMLALETAMLTQFGEMNAEDSRLMIFSTGVGMCLIILFISIYTIRKNSKVIAVLTKL